MKNKKKIIMLVVICMFIFFGIVEVVKSYLGIYNDKEYKKLGLKIDEYDIEYCTIYKDDFLDGKYKVYKIKNYNTLIMDKFRYQLEESDLWNKNKYYEYIMKEFLEINDDKQVYIDREDLYFYNGNNAYAIFDIKNAKLYYYVNRVFNNHVDYHKDFNLDLSNYENKEIYDVRGGPQGDGRDYYIYMFSDNEGKKIIEELEHSSKWSRNKLSEEILNDFEYNIEVHLIEKGYYYFKLVCRTSDEKEKINVTEENATGYEMAVYDVKNNILYYFWESI